jgi:hypothetical protein
LYGIFATYFDKALSSILLSISQFGAIGANSYTGIMIFTPIVEYSDRIVTKDLKNIESTKSKKIIKTDLINWG